MMRWATRAVPVPAASLEPPAASGLDPYPVVVSVGPLTNRSVGCDRRFLNGHAFFGCEKKSVLLAIGGNPFASDETCVVNGLGHGQDLEVARRKIADRVEIEHLAICKEERVNGTIRGSGESDDLSGTVARERAALIPSDCSKVCHSLFGITKRVIRTCVAKVGSSRRTFGGAGVGGTACAPQRAEIVHGGISIKKGVSRPVLELSDTCDLPGRANRIGRTGGPAQRA